MWWKEAVFYQIYLQSFCDSNDDGVGDIPGVTSQLDYLQKLGVDALWLTPFYKSPFKDFGYDIENYYEVDPLFGNIEDFKTLLSRAHEKGLKIIIDMAFSHSSDQCPYFLNSNRSEKNMYSDWYVWADGKSDGSPPNNWKSIFGGDAWTYSKNRKQFYLHNFLAEQPDLNFHNPAVQDEVLKIMRFWYELGVDGFRLDVCNFYFHDQKLRDNPPRPKNERPTGGSILNSPYQHQLHIFDKDQNENLLFLELMRKTSDTYQEKFLMAEIASDQQTKIIREYTTGHRLHSAYSFELLVDHFSVDEIIRVGKELSEHHPCWSFSNHDVRRVATRWAQGDPEVAKNLFVLLLSLKGTPIIYQGEECGFEESDLAYEDLVDPYGLAFYPDFKGRDGCRTPMAWASVMPKMWLPVDSKHKQHSIDKQDQDPLSFLNFARQWINFRKQYKEILAHGEIEFLVTAEEFHVLRKYKSDKLRFVFTTDFKKFRVIHADKNK